LVHPTTKFALLTAKSVGVLGGPSADSTLVDSGKAVPFSFQSQDGYGSVSVLLDGTSTAASGNVVMNGRHVLAAGATPLMQSSRADSGVAATARAVLTGVNPSEAMNTLVTSLDSMLRGLSADAAAAAIQRVRAASYGVSVSEEQLRKIDQQLVGKVFTAPLAGSSASSSASRYSTGFGATYTVPLTLFFSNGIDVDPSEFAADFTYFAGGQLLGDLGAIPHDPSVPMSVHAVYNQTHGLVTSVTMSCIVAAWQASFMQALDWVAQYQRFASCGGDLGASAQDIANLLNGGDASVDAARLASLLSAELKQGHAVIVVGHSRGNLVAQQAIGLLTTTPPAGIDDASKCLGMVSIASPLWQPNALPLGLLSGTIASGTYVPDILIQAVPGTAKAAATSTDLTRRWDLAYLGLGIGTSGIISGVVRVAGGLDIHHFSSYATATTTRSLIQSAIQSVAGTLQSGCLLRTPTAIKLSSSDNVSAQAGSSLASPVVYTVTDANGQLVQNRVVHFAVQGGILAPADANTGADGSVSVNVKTTSITGPATLSATVTGTSIAPAILHVVVTPPPDVPRISLSTTAASFSATAGGGNPGVQTISVSNVGTGTLGGLALSTTYQAGQPVGWLSATLGSAVAPTTIQLSASTASLAAGTYTATVGVASTAPGVANSPQSVSVTLVVSAQSAPRIAVSPSSLSFTGTVGGANAAAQTASVTNAGGGSLGGLTASVSYPAGQPTGWLSATLSGTVTPATINVTPTVGSLAAGSYSATVQVASSASGVANSPQLFSVSLTIAAGGPAVSQVAVSPFSVWLPIGRTQQLLATAYDVSHKAIPGATISWSYFSGASSAATISASGIITAASIGNVLFAATSGGQSGYVGVCVVAASARPTARIQVSPASATIAVGGTFQFSAMAYDASDNPLAGVPIDWEWLSATPGVSGTAIATVSGTGLATGVGPGTATVVAVTNDCENVAGATTLIVR
jgi:hypothetical protein